MSETQKHLGDVWAEDVTTVRAILADINAEMTKKLGQNSYLTDRKITISIPRLWMDLLKDKPAPYGPRVNRFSCWDYIIANNLLASIGVPYEILPRYSFKDIKGTVDTSWTGRNAQESGEELKSHLDNFMKLPTIERGRRNEGDPDAVPDPSWGGFMESDASLRKRALAYHVNQKPDVVATEIPPFDAPRESSITGNDVKVSIERVKETPYSIRVNSAFVGAVSRRLGSQDWSWPAKVSICEEVIAEYLAVKSRDDQ